MDKTRATKEASGLLDFIASGMQDEQVNMPLVMTKEIATFTEAVIASPMSPRNRAAVINNPD